MTVKKKILFILPTLRGAGAEKVLIDILNRFDYSRYSVDLILFNDKGELFGSLNDNVNLHILYTKRRPKIPLIENRYTKGIMQAIRVAMLLKPWIKYDTIISFLEGEALSLHTKLVNRGKRNVSWVHIDLLLNHWTRKEFRSLSSELNAYKKMDFTVFVSNQAKLAFNKLFGEVVKSNVIPNIINKDNIVKLASEFIPSAKTRRITICTVGRLTRQKRQDRMIKAIDILLKQYNLDVELWLLGQGEEEKALRQLAEKLNIRDRIKFLGYKNNPYPYIKAADIFALSSDAEGYPLVVCEALCLGKPIVSTDTTGPDELLREDIGILTHLDEKSLAIGIAKICCDPSLLRQYSERSETKSLEFSTDKIMNSIYKVING